MTDKQKGQISFRPLTGNTFRFRCHKDIPCFTKCCANLNLVLTPYDILRLKNHLKVSSDDFLNRYTETTWDDHARFPMTSLKMNGDENRTCPFVSTLGCTIYEDRPGACRIYPLGRAATKPDAGRDAMERFFVVDEKHCLGFSENREWSIEEWMKNEGLDEYNAMNDRWLEIITTSRSLGPEKDVPRKIQMFYTASYHLDKFREFIFRSKFFELFEMEQGLKKRLAIDDVALMKFACDWLKFSLFGETTIRIKKNQSS